MSILCTAYNHERYIEEAILGFLAQESRFPVEILIHDDASTDGTAAIVKKYAETYPGLIRPVLQLENQHSLGHWAIVRLITEARGAYIALCEGDDFWTCSDKLQVQVETMLQNPAASGCFHKADALMQSSGDRLAGHFAPYTTKNTYDIDDILVRGNFVATHSIMFRRDFLAAPPEWLSDVPHCDIALLCIAGSEGPLVYLDRSMGVYRKHDEGLHSRDHVILQHVKSLRTYYMIGEKLGALDRPAFKQGVQYSMDEIARTLRSYDSRIQFLEEQHRQDRAAIARIMRSRTFKVGLALSKARDRMKGLVRS